MLFNMVCRFGSYVFRISVGGWNSTAGLICVAARFTGPSAEGEGIDIQRSRERWQEELLPIGTRFW
jgi:hypothetical protein